MASGGGAGRQERSGHTEKEEGRVKTLVSERKKAD